MEFNSRIGTALFCLLMVGLSAVAKEGRPNILVIMSDDQGFADVSYNSHSPKEVHTPHIDALAASGVECTQGYTTGHVCSPTRLGLMTGRYQQRYGTYSAGQCGSGIPVEHKLIANYMQNAGYTNGAFGKWHMGITIEHHPCNRGFDTFYGFMGRGAHDFFELSLDYDGKFSGPIYRNLEEISDEGYLTTRITEEAVKFIKANKDRSWFCYVPYNAVHAPAQAPEADIKDFDTGSATRNILMAMLRHLDLGIGEIIQTLKDTGVYENTIVFFLSDNGGSGVMEANNAPFRGFKQMDYEGGVHVPFIVSWPGKLEAGSKCNVPVFSFDILPTACAAAGVKIPADHGLDGKNILPVLMGEEDKVRDFMFWNDSAGKWAVRNHEGWKLVGDKGKTELFNLKEDIAEEHDLFGQYPEKVAQLMKAYDPWIDAMGEPSSGYKRWSPKADAGGGNKKNKKKKKKK